MTELYVLVRNKRNKAGYRPCIIVDDMLEAVKIQRYYEVFENEKLLSFRTDNLELINKAALEELTD